MRRSSAIPNLDIAICVDWHRAQRGLNMAAEKSAGNARYVSNFSLKNYAGIPFSCLWDSLWRNREVLACLRACLKGLFIDEYGWNYSGCQLKQHLSIIIQDRYRFDRLPFVIQIENWPTAWLNWSAEGMICSFLRYKIVSDGSTIDERN